MVQPNDPFQLCGTTIEGKYRIASVVGDGGFGVVYRAVHKGFGELIAVKCLKMPTALDEKERDELLEQLKDEGRLLHRLSRATSGIVQALDVGAFTTPAGTWVPYLVLEWLEGETLGEYMRRRAKENVAGMTPADAVALLDPAARALAVAHAQKIAHRDVKPANLFLTEVGGVKTLKVLDFGIAKVLSEHQSHTAALAATVNGPSAFTPRYGAPEQFNKQRGATGPWTDVFALALIFVELVSGKKALDGDDPTQLYIASADPTLRPTLRARGVEASDALEGVVAKALSVEPKHRYPSLGEFWGDLSRAVSGASPSIDPRAGQAAPVERKDARASDAAMDGPEHDPKAPTMPIESLRDRVPAVRANVATSAVDEAAHRSPTPRARADDGDDEDPMAETPMPARVRPPIPSGPSDAPQPAPDPYLSADSSAARPSIPVPRGRSAPAPGSTESGRAPWGWIATALFVGGAVFAYVTWGNSAPSPKVSTPPSLASHAKTGPKSKPAPTSQASAVASGDAAMASASAVVPTRPPDDMVYVAAATAKLGKGTDAREVTLTRGFYIDRYEVTVRAYEACMAERMCSSADRVALTPEKPNGTPAPWDEYSDAFNRRCNAKADAPDHPINCVDFANAESFCRWRGRRLPTEAEWELAARGTEGREFPWGHGAPDCERSCFDRNVGCMHPGAVVSTCVAGSHPGDRTASGIYDLAGNVAEWVSDGFVVPPPAGTDPKGDPNAPLRVVRGGSYFDSAEKLETTWRSGAAPVTAFPTIGFRCAMDADPALPAPGQATP